LEKQTMADSSPNPNNNVFCLPSHVAMEGFEDGALLLHLEDRRLLELNPVAHHILTQTDGQRNTTQIATALANTFDIAVATALQNIVSLHMQLSDEGLIEIVEPPQNKKEGNQVEDETIESPRYIRHLDVVLREKHYEGSA
jgi:hypothetical protein